MYTTVVTASRQGGIRQGLTYETDQEVKPGTLVRIPLRKQIVEGIVAAIHERRGTETFDVKTIQGILSDTPLLTEAQMKTVAWMADEYMTTLRHLLSIWLPPPPWKLLLPKPVVGYRIGADAATRGNRQRAVVDFLKTRGWVSERELRGATNASKATLKSLARRGAILEETHAERSASHAILGYEQFVKASPDLPPGVSGLLKDIAASQKPSLLLGGTLRERVELYAELITETLKKGQQAILLLPDMLLVSEVQKLLSDTVDPRITALLGSNLTPAVRRKEWKRIRSGEAGLVIGTRTALFAPAARLGLVILDDEHAWTWKNEQTPRYHARKTAEALCRATGAKLLLASPSPSLESYARVKSGRYLMHALQSRETRPPIRIVDLASVQFGPLYPFSGPLIEAIGARIDRSEQSLLLLNRRGHATSLLCMECRRRIASTASKIPYTVHRDLRGRAFLFDHATGERAALPAVCPTCGSTSLREIGAGTQRVEQMLRKIFPRARVLRADRESLLKPGSLARIVRAMRAGEADILLGTQSIVKGVDLPEVTLAAAILADVGLSAPDFRAGERLWQLLTDLTLSLRSHSNAEVIIQTFRPDAPEIALLGQENAITFLEQELKLRTFALYPPASRMIRLLQSGNGSQEASQRLVQLLKAKAGKESLDLTITRSQRLGERGRSFQILIRGSDPRSVLKGINVDDVVIDVDPEETA